MKLLLLLSLQAAAAPAPAPAYDGIGAADFDLAKVKRADGLDTLFACDKAGGSEIVVCGRRRGYAYPLDEMAKIFEAKPLRAETGLGNGAVADVRLEQVDLGPSLSPSAHGGLRSNRIMVGIKMPF
jgi:hypothetical protein